MCLYILQLVCVVVVDFVDVPVVAIIVVVLLFVGHERVPVCVRVCVSACVRAFVHTSTRPTDYMRPRACVRFSVSVDVLTIYCVFVYLDVCVGSV